MSSIPIEKNEKISTGLDILIRKGKETLEQLFKPINQNYKCNIIRAGGYNIEPSKDIIKILKKYHFKMDSSVYAGGYIKSELSNYDYSNIKNNIPYWFCSDNSVLDIMNKKTELIELPIFAHTERRFIKYNLQRIKIALKNKKQSLETIQSKTANKTFLDKIKFLFEKEAITWDFCLFSKNKMNQYLNLATKINKHSKFNFHPFVLIGHPKGFYFEDALIFFIKKILIKNNQFINLTDTLKNIEKNNNEK